MNVDTNSDYRKFPFLRRDIDKTQNINPLFSIKFQNNSQLWTTISLLYQYYYKIYSFDKHFYSKFSASVDADFHSLLNYNTTYGRLTSLRAEWMTELHENNHPHISA